MSRLEEILEKNWSYDHDNTPIEELYIGQYDAIVASMKEYAIEIATASLAKAAENARVEYDIWGDAATVKESITSTDNIVKL